MSKTIEQVKPQVLHIMDIGNEIANDGQSGQIYIALTPETPTAYGAWAEITFTCSIQIGTEWGLTWGMKEIAYPVIEDITNIIWEVAEVNDCEWSPSDSDKDKIVEMIGDYVAQNIDVMEIVS